VNRSGKPLTTRQKFAFYEHQTFGPPAIFSPAFSAGIRMARPNNQYPPEWQDGMGAFGRLFGSTLATQTTKHTAEFITEAAFHYDARYHSSKSTRVIPRIGNAILSIAIEKTDAGATTFALPHFAGAAAGGFIGMAYLPPGFDTLSKAGQRTGSELMSIGFRNLAQEFAPELAPLARHIHLPRVIPVWWAPRQATRATTP